MAQNRQGTGKARDFSGFPLIFLQKNTFLHNKTATRAGHTGLMQGICYNRARFFYPLYRLTEDDPFYA